MIVADDADVHSRIVKRITSINILAPPKEYIEMILRILCEELDYQYGSVIKVAGPQQPATIVAVHRLPPDYPIKVREMAPFSSGPFLDALSTCRIVAAIDVSKNAALTPWLPLLSPLGVVSIVWVPLLNGVSAYGAYALYSTKPRDPGDRELDILEQASRLISLAIVANNYLDESNSKSRELEQALVNLENIQAKLVQTEKMAAIGQLAAGVSHEINNPLGVILGFAQGMEQRVPEGDPLRLPVTSIIREVLRCKELVQELLTFSRAAKRTNEEVYLNSLVDSSLVFVEARARAQGVQITTLLSEDLPPLLGARTPLQQVIVNLATNALDAMPSGGTLTLRTKIEEAEVILEVTDTGTGIPEEIRSRIFDPFFTTKEAGKGTGLGLSLGYEIVQQHGGTIDVQSEVGKGTTMLVRFSVNPEVRE
jgi:signal transduction histidine kinase